MDIRGKLEVGGPEEIPEVETSGRPTRAPYGNKAVSYRTSVGQEVEGEYKGDVY